AWRFSTKSPRLVQIRLDRQAESEDKKSGRPEDRPPNSKVLLVTGMASLVTGPFPHMAPHHFPAAEPVPEEFPHEDGPYPLTGVHFGSLHPSSCGIGWPLPRDTSCARA